MTVSSIALVIFSFVAIMSLAIGLERALTASGDPLNVLIRRRGAGSEQSSSIPRDALPAIKYIPGIKPGSDGEPLVAAHIVVSIYCPKIGQEEGANIVIRGISLANLELHPQVRRFEGRMFQSGLREVIVSRTVSRRFQDTGLGARLRFGRGEWEVVGIFEADNTAFDSEIWTDVNQLASDYNRQTFSSVLVRAADEATVREIMRTVENDQRFNLMAQVETKYYEEQSQAANPIKILGMFIAIVMGIGACFAATNTMYSSVTYRAREIVTLEVLGFKKRQILISFIIESVLLALAGGFIGFLLILPLNGITTGTLNQHTYSEITFAFRFTPYLLIMGILFAVLIGITGGFFPARHATRQMPSDLMRGAD